MVASACAVITVVSTAIVVLMVFVGKTVLDLIRFLAIHWILLGREMCVRLDIGPRGE